MLPENRDRAPHIPVVGRDDVADERVQLPAVVALLRAVRRREAAQLRIHPRRVVALVCVSAFECDAPLAAEVDLVALENCRRPEILDDDLLDRRVPILMCP
jgi:hypothetical protein